jgi:hypothetical protein
MLAEGEDLAAIAPSCSTVTLGDSSVSITDDPAVAATLAAPSRMSR